VGARFTNRVKGVIIKKLFIVVMIILGLSMIMSGVGI